MEKYSNGQSLMNGQPILFLILISSFAYTHNYYYLYMNIYVHACIHTYIHKYVHTCMHAYCVHICTTCVIFVAVFFGAYKLSQKVRTVVYVRCIMYSLPFVI